MARNPIIRENPPKVPPDCIHCYGSGCIYEATEDASQPCHMCLGTGRKMNRAERERLKSDRELDAQYSALERMGL
jgi:hypothetical protein